jgi:hypothetical protein
VSVTLNNDHHLMTFHVDNLMPLNNTLGVPTPAWGGKGMLTPEDTPQVPVLAPNPSFCATRFHFGL